MRLSAIHDSKLWQIRLLVLLLYPLVLIKVLWVRRSPGLLGIAKYSVAVAQSVLGVIVGFYFLRGRGFSVLSLHAFMRSVDDRIDGDWFLPWRMDLDTYLAQKDRLFAAIGANSNCRLLTEDIFLIDLIKEGQLQGMDLVPNFQRMWGWYRQDVNRQLTGKLPVTFAEPECPATKANVEFFYIFFRLIGGDPSNSHWIIQEAVIIFMMCDVLNDLVRDVRLSISWVPQDVLTAHGLSADDLQQLTGWADVQQNMQLVAWYDDQTKQVTRRWTDLKGKLYHLMQPLIPQAKLRTLFIATVSKQFDLVIKQCRQRARLLTQLPEA